jgi:hypothetical protein
MNKDRPEAALVTDGEKVRNTVTRHRRQFAYRVDAERVRHRALQDALGMALASFWDRRAAALAAALPRPGDFVGSATPEEIEERTQRLREAIAACQVHADLLEDAEPFADEITAILREAS